MLGAHDDYRVCAYVRAYVRSTLMQCVASISSAFRVREFPSRFARPRETVLVLLMKACRQTLTSNHAEMVLTRFIRGWRRNRRIPRPISSSPETVPGAYPMLLP